MDESLQTHQNRRQLIEIILITFPTIIEFTLQTLVNYADFIMVGRLGIEASATIGITNEVTFMVKAATNALGVGILAFVAKEYGAGKKDIINLSAYKAYELGIITGVVTTVICLVISSYLPVFLGAEEAIRKPASMYFAICSSTSVFYSMNVAASSLRKATKDMKSPLIVNGMVNILNIILNYFLIYQTSDIQLFGKTVRLYRAGLGVQGAAIGTALSIAAGGIIMLIVNERYKESAATVLTGSYISAHKNEGKSISQKYIAVGLPAFLTTFVTCLGRIIFTKMIVPMGTTIYAAHTIAFTAESVFYMPVAGMGTAIASLSGNVKGEGNLKKLNRQTNLVCVITFCVMVVSSLILLTCAEWIIALFTQDSDVLAIAPKLLYIVAINEPIFGVGMVMQYIFEGIGKTKPPLYASFFAQWAIRVAGTYIFVYRLGYGIYTAWFCMIADNIVKSIILYILYWKYNDRLMD